jgi:hypothetical protein
MTSRSVPGAGRGCVVPRRGRALSRPVAVPRAGQADPRERRWARTNCPAHLPIRGYRVGREAGFGSASFEGDYVVCGHGIALLASRSRPTVIAVRWPLKMSRVWTDHCPEGEEWTILQQWTRYERSRRIAQMSGFGRYCAQFAETLPWTATLAGKEITRQSPCSQIETITKVRSVREVGTCELP